MSSVYVGIILVMRVVQSCFSKKASILLPQELKGRIKYFSVSQMAAAGLALLSVLFMNELTEIDLQTLVIATLSGVSLVLSSICGILAIQSGTIALNSMFGTAGLLVPCIAGIFLFHEPMSHLQWVGVLILFISAYLLVVSSKQTYTGFSKKTVLLLLGTFLFNGLTMLFQLIFSRFVPNGSVSMFSFLTFLIPGLVLTCILPFLKNQKGEGDSKDSKLPKKLIYFSLLLAVAVFVINQLATIASALLSPVILFAFINGGGTVIATIVAAVMFHERITLRSACGVVLGVASLIIIKAF